MLILMITVYPRSFTLDILGTQIYSPKKESFSIKKGPIFSNFIFADEINRAQKSSISIVRGDARETNYNW